MTAAADFQENKEDEQVESIRQLEEWQGLRGINRVWEFDAPVETVFRAHTDPLWLARWLVPEGVELRFRRWDARTGGSWSYSVGAGGDDWTFNGSFHEVSEPWRIVQTVEAEADSHGPVLEVLDFLELPGGGCRLEAIAMFTSPAAREEVGGSDDDGGLARLNDLLSELGAFSTPLPQ
ncbi:SRPBCC domain-containing protein [Arthrobacter woluwensis]|uniref:SRPBCC domain-containing protein n=1 Tax=Arthrobacter woluwensis TaxID=156980 RepID=UPI0011A36976|nr:SRPBCC domain-containing protein [Arthrobacter woluwensis]